MLCYIWAEYSQIVAYLMKNVSLSLVQPGPVLFGQNFMNGKSIMRVHLQKILNKLLTFLWNIVVDILKVPFLDLLEEFILTLGSERVVPLEHHIEENTQRPHISVDGRMVNFRHNLRCHVGRCSTKGINSIWFFAPETEAKIYQFELSMPINKNVLSFDISMNDISFMQVQKHLRNNQKKLFGLLFRQSVLWFWQEIVVKGVGSSVLQN